MMILIEGEVTTLEPLRQQIEERGEVTVSHGDHRFTVGDTVTVTLNDADHVVEESAGMAKAFPHPDAAGIAQAARRLELSWDRAADPGRVTNIVGTIEPAVARLYGRCWLFDDAIGDWM